MKNENKKEVKKDIANGATSAAGATAGAVAGVFIGTAVSPQSASAQEVQVVRADVRPNHVNHNPKPETNVSNSDNQGQVTPPKPEPNVGNSDNQGRVTPPKPEPNKPEDQVTVQTTDDQTTDDYKVDGKPEDVEVISYERITDINDHTQFDRAFVIQDGILHKYEDHDLDGSANFVWRDLNGNGVKDEGESANITGQGVDMHHFAEIYGFDEGFLAQNNIPDYVNDADVDNFMA